MNLQLERELIDRFICKSKRERLKQFAGKSNTRDKMVRALSGPDVFEQDRLTKIEGQNRTFDGLLKIYRDAGMGAMVYVISENSDWDGQEMPTKLILEQSLASCIDVLAYCPKSKTAFYEWHHSGSSFLLESKRRQITNG